MTVREWFRLQRKALWESEQPRYTTCGYAVDLHQLTEKVIHGTTEPIESVGEVKIIFAGLEAYETRTAMIRRLQAKIECAVLELDRELARREQVTWLAKDLLT